MTLEEMHEKFPTHESCLKYIYNQRHKTVKCPECGRVDRMYFNKRHKIFTCACGQYSILPRNGTLFEASGVKLPIWFSVLFHFAENALTTEDIAKLGVSSKTAHTMNIKIMEWIYWNADLSISSDEKKSIRKEIAAFHSYVSPKLEHLYITQFAFRKHYRKDRFEILLDMAIHPKNLARN